MKRRAFLGNFGKLSVAAGAVTLVGAAASRPDAATTGAVPTEGIVKRLDRLERYQKRTLKAVFILLALAVGIDLSLLL